MAKPKPKPKRPRKRTPPKPKSWRPAFLAALRQLGNATAAAEAAKVDRSTAYTAREADEKFKALWEAAVDEAADRLEVEARRRATEGWEEPVYGSGGRDVGTVLVGTVRRFSDSLLIFLLKGARPEKYRERFDLNHRGKVEKQVLIYLPNNGRDSPAAGSAGAVPGDTR